MYTVFEYYIESRFTGSHHVSLATIAASYYIDEATFLQDNNNVSIPQSHDIYHIIVSHQLLAHIQIFSK